MVTSKQPKGGQGTTGVRTRSGPVKMIQGRRYIEYTENSRQGRVDGEV